MRPGLARVYNQRSREIKTTGALSPTQQREFSFGRVKAAAEWAYMHVLFYADLYLKHGVDPTKFRHFEDLLSLPIVTKQALQAVPLEYRSTYISASSLENTDGYQAKRIIYSGLSPTTQKELTPPSISEYRTPYT